MTPTESPRSSGLEVYSDCKAPRPAGQGIPEGILWNLWNRCRGTLRLLNACSRSTAAARRRLAHGFQQQ